MCLHVFVVFFQIKYFNNKIICDLVEQQHSGVIALLDEACFLVGTVTDKVSTCINNLLSAIHKHSVLYMYDESSYNGHVSIKDTLL